MNSASMPVREIISESNITPRLIEEITIWNDPPSPTESFCLKNSAINRASETWRDKISKDAAQMAKAASGGLADLAEGCIYKNLNSKHWKTAASLTEIFRDPAVSKNAGRLDAQTLQRVFFEQLGANGELSFSISWGQAKRDAGGLKTLGPLADMSELCAVITLATVVRTAEIVCGKAVRLTVVTGGSRYYEALFTCPQVSEAYDSQRQRMADTLCGPGKIQFVPYARSCPPSPTQADLDLVPEAAISAKFVTVLLNVDWMNVFAQSSRDMTFRPHDIHLPPALHRWINYTDEPNRRKLVRHTIMGLLNPRSVPNGLAAYPGDEEIFDAALSFLQRVAWESTRKYIALQSTQKEGDGAGYRSGIQLTVHEKRDQRHIPAILTLGSGAGNLLSQHVLTLLSDTGSARFVSFAELQDTVARPVYVGPDAGETGELFDWLAGTDQPLCFLEPSVSSPEQSIGRVFVE